MKRISIVVMALALLMACGPAAKEKTAETQVPPPRVSGEKEIKLTPEQKNSSLIQLVQVKRDSVDVSIEVLGAIASDTDRVTQLRPKVFGKVTELLVGVGDLVTPGQTLLRYSGGELKAEQKGVVLGIYADVGDFVDPVVPLVTLADTSTLRCILDVFEKDIGLIRKGQKVRVRTTAFSNEVFEGTVAYISPRVNENSRTIKVRADIANSGNKLKFGMFVTGTIDVSDRKALVVPQTAVQEVDGKSMVFVLKDADTLVARPVTVGDRVDGKIEITSGLQEGEMVLGQGSFILKNEFNKDKGSDDNG